MLQRSQVAGLAIRLVIIFVLAWTAIIACEVVEDQGLINEVQESAIRFGVWAILSGWLLYFVWRAKLGLGVNCAVFAFLFASCLGYALALTEDIESLDRIAVIGHRGFMHRMSEKLVGAFASVSLFWLFFGLLAMLARAESELERKVADREREILVRKEAEEGLRQSLSLLQAIVEGTTDAIYIKDEQGRYVLSNTACARAFGCTPSEVIGQSDRELFPADIAESIRALDKLVMEEGKEQVEEQSLSFGTESRIYLTVKAPFRDADGGIQGIVGISRDVTRLRQTERNLHLTQYAIDRTTDSAFWLRSDGSFRYVNDSACRSLGYTREELLSMNVHEIDCTISDQDWEARWQEKSRQGNWKFESIHRRKDGHEFPVEITSSFVVFDGQEYHCSLARDLTELRAAEEESRQHLAQLAHVSRVSSMGEMATGLAHELNQPLGSIVNLTYLQQQVLERTEPSIQEIKELSSRISDQAFRASEFIRRMRTLARPTEPERQPLPLNDAIREVVLLMRGDLRLSRIDLTLDLLDQSPVVLADRIQIQQVLVNLLRNAIDSLTASVPPRQIIVESRQKVPGRAMFTVTDTGGGFIEENMERILEPFCSTKSEGMGMGLAISRTIIEAHGGRICFGNNESGSGGYVSVELPVLEPDGDNCQDSSSSQLSVK